MSYDGKKHHLGVSNTKEEAAAVYDRVAREHRGSAAVCDFVTAEEGEAASAAASAAAAAAAAGAAAAAAVAEIS